MEWHAMACGLTGAVLEVALSLPVVVTSIYCPELLQDTAVASNLRVTETLLFICVSVDLGT